MGFLDFLTRGLKKTRNNLVVQVDGISGKLTPETLEELEEYSGAAGWVDVCKNWKEEG